MEMTLKELKEYVESMPENTMVTVYFAGEEAADGK